MTQNEYNIKYDFFCERVETYFNRLRMLHSDYIERAGNSKDDNDLRLTRLDTAIAMCEDIEKMFPDTLAEELRYWRKQLFDIPDK